MSTGHKGIQQFSVSFAGDCFVANAPRNDIVIIFTVIASPDARDKLHETISYHIAKPRDCRVAWLLAMTKIGQNRILKKEVKRLLRDCLQ